MNILLLDFCYHSLKDKTQDDVHALIKNFLQEILADLEKRRNEEIQSECQKQENKDEEDDVELGAEECSYPP